MLLQLLLRVAARRPALGARLIAAAARDRLGRHRESDAEHLLDVLRHAARFGLDVALDGDELRLVPAGGAAGPRCALRLSDSDVRVYREVIVHGEYRAALEGLASRRADPWIVDAGANVGLMTVFLKDRVPGARVVALEPDAANAARFRRHVELNRFAGVALREAALWPFDTGLRFVPDAAAGPSWGFRVEACADGPVAGISVPSLLSAHGIDEIDLLKLDVEGSEFPLLADPGAPAWLARVRSIVAEWHPALGDVARVNGVLGRAGFRVRDLGANLVYADRAS